MIALVDDPEARSRREAVGREALAHADALFRLAHHLARDRAQAEDLVQETFAHALRAAAELTRRERLKPWLFQILRRLHQDAARRVARRGQEEELDDDAESAGGSWLRGDAELERLRGVVGEEIDAALARLGDEARTVVLLDVEGLTEGEIADVLGCAVGTVKSRLSRARAALRDALAEYRR